MRINLANFFTGLRIFLAFPIFFLLMKGTPTSKISVIILFAFGGLTDYLDGKIARIYKTETEFGKFLDPLADKILVISILIALVIVKKIPAWMVILIAIREVLVTFLRTKNLQKFSPTLLAKSKTAIQIYGIVIILSIPFLKLGEFENLLIFVIMSIILLITLISGVQYFLIARRKM